MSVKTLGQFKREGHPSATPARIPEEQIVEIPVEVLREITVGPGLKVEQIGKTSKRISLEDGVVFSEPGPPGPAGPPDARVDKLDANLLSTSSALTDTDETITLAQGRRRTLAPNTLTSRRTKTVSVVGAELGDTITVDRRDKSHFFMRFINAGSGTLIGQQQRVGTFVMRFNGTDWESLTLTRNSSDGFFNVRDFGADGQNSALHSTAVETACVQACIDAAAAAAREIGGSTGGAVIYFPRGIYDVDTLLWRRTPLMRPLHFVGEGWDATFVNCSSGVAFEVETAATDPDLTRGGYGHTMREMVIATADYPCVRYDVGGGLVDSARGQVHFNKVRFHRSGGTTISARTGIVGCGCVEIKWGFRCRFSECIFSPGNDKGRTGVVLDNCGGCAFSMCDQLATSGGFIDAYNSGEISIIACRSEGGRQIPSWRFVNCQEVQLSGCTNEGTLEWPACFYFENCFSVTLIGLGMATNNYPHGFMGGALGTIYNHPVPQTVTFAAGEVNTITRSSGSWIDDNFEAGQNAIVTESVSNNGTFPIINVTDLVLMIGASLTNETVACRITNDVWADGISFVRCNNVRMIAGNAPGSFNSLGNQLGRAVRIDADCHDIEVEVSGGSNGGSEIEIDPAAIELNCHAVYTCSQAFNTHVQRVGRKLFNSLGITGLSTELNARGGVPAALAGHAVGRGVGSDHAALWWVEAVEGTPGRFVAAYDDAGDHETLMSRIEVEALGFRPATQAPNIQQIYQTTSRVLASYTPDPESSVYTGATDSEAKLTDLNSLRVAYENLRGFVESLGGVTNQLITDLRMTKLLKSFEPVDLLNLTLWVRGDRGRTVVGNEVQAWADQSGSALYFGAPTGGSFPHVGTIGGQLAVDFDGVLDFLGHTIAGPGQVALSDIITATAWTCFCVIEVDAVATDNALAYQNDPVIAADSGRFTVGSLQSTGPKVGVGSYDNSGKQVYTPITLGVPHVIESRMEGNFLFISVDGGAEVSTGIGTIDTLVGPVYLGTGGNLAHHFNGRIGEVVVFNTAKPASERTLIRAYLKERYGIA